MVLDLSRKTRTGREGDATKRDAEQKPAANLEARMRRICAATSSVPTSDCYLRRALGWLCEYMGHFRYEWLKKHRFERRHPPFENGLEIRAQTK